MVIRQKAFVMWRATYLLLIFMTLSSCSKYQKLLKSDDVDLKYNSAMNYYGSKDYTRAAELFTSVIPTLNGTEKIEIASYKKAMCYFNQKDYMSAGHYFGNFLKRFPSSDSSEMAQFNKAYCLFKQSPNPELDQEITKQAIQEFQLFSNVYPESEKLTQAESYVDILKDKLIKKSYLSAKLYFDLGDYRGNNYSSAVITAQNSLKEYPETKYREELSFLILKAKYEQAINSVPKKMEDRYIQTVDEYYSFMNEFPESKFKKEVNNMFTTSMEYLKTLSKNNKSETKKELKKAEKSGLD